MATTVGKLATVLTANTSPFERGMKKAEATVKRFGSSIAAVAKRTAQFGAVAGAVAVGGMAVMVRRQFSAIDATAKLSDRIGIATEKLIGLRYAANIMGATTAELDKGLEQMTRRLGEAAMGTGMALRTLEALGLNVQMLTAMAPDQAFRTIADAINGMGTQAEKANAAYQIFGRTGIQLLNTLSLGSEGLDRMQKRAEELGITFTRFDAAKVEQANDAFFDMKLVITGVAQTLAIQLAPWVQAVSERFVDATTAGGGFGTHVVAAVRGVVKAMAFVADAVHSVILLFKGLQLFVVKGMNFIVQSIVDVAKTLQGLANLIPGVELEFEHFFHTVGNLSQIATDIIEKNFNDALLAPTFGDRVDAFFDQIEARANKLASQAASNPPVPFFDPETLGQAERVAKRIEFGRQVRFRSEINVSASRQNDPIKLVEKNTKKQADEAKTHTQQNAQTNTLLQSVLNEFSKFGVLSV